MGTPARLILLGSALGDLGLNPGLVDVAGVPLVNYWLLALRSCPRLLPASQKVFIVTSPETHEAFEAWARDRELSAGGFPVQNLLCVGDSSGADALGDVSRALPHIPGATDGVLLVASLDVFYGPTLNLTQLLEHTIVRGKTTLVYHKPPPGRSMAGQAEVLINTAQTITLTGQATNPRVGGLDLAPPEPADGVNTAAMAPFVLLHKSSLPALMQAVEQGSVAPGPLQLASFVSSHLLEQGVPVYCLHVDMCLECSTGYGVQYARLFMDYLHNETDRRAKQGPAAQALAVVTASAQESGVVTRGDKDVDDLLTSVSEAKRHLIKFDVHADRMLAEQAAQSASATGPQIVTFVRFGMRDTLPTRFQDVTTRRHRTKVEHPVYQTTANEIGRKAPTQLDMPDVYAGSAGGFTKTFAGPPKNRGLITSITRSKVHKLLDDF